MILVTGATGLIGSHLLYELAGMGTKIRALSRSPGKQEKVKRLFSCYTENYEELFSSIEWYEGNILDMESLDIALKDAEQVYHCAAIVSFDPGEKDAIMKNNVTGTVNVVNACLEHKIRKLCFVSSTAAIGQQPDNVEADETSIWKHTTGQSTYSRSKHQAEMEVWRGMAEGLNAVIVNPAIVIGRGDWNKSSSVIFKTVWEGLTFYTNGITGYVDVRDVVRAMIRLTESNISEERFILSATDLSYRQIFEMVAMALNKKPPKFYAGPVLTGLAWRLDWMISKLFSRKPKLTRETAGSAHSISRFSNEKIRKATGIEFRPVKESIEFTAKAFLKDMEQ